MIISPIESLWIYSKRFFASYLTLIDFLVRHFENQQAQILAGALHIAQRVTEAQSAKLKKQPFRIIYCKPISRALSLLVCGI